MCGLIEGTFATGSHVFRPGRDYTPALPPFDHDGDASAEEEEDESSQIVRHNCLSILYPISNPQ